IYRNEKGIIKTVEPLHLLTDALYEIISLASNIKNKDSMFFEPKNKLTSIIEELFELQNLFEEYMRQSFMQVRLSERNTQYI
ncbi:hypothetical protein, partial [Enterobacter hormaechei]